jgi:hypothetical protein
MSGLLPSSAPSPRSHLMGHGSPQPPAARLRAATWFNSRWTPEGSQPALWLAVGFGAFLYVMLPAGVTVMNDDFGYLGSVIETIQRGRPWTDEWLEPWSGSLAAFSALGFKLTGSFLIATQGLQAVYAAGAAALTYLLFRTLGLAVRESVIAAVLALSFPTLLWKFIEFTSMTVYLPCLLGAMWAAGQRRWWWFFLFGSRLSQAGKVRLPGLFCRCGRCRPIF